mgnify:CR=1 FL=1
MRTQIASFETIADVHLDLLGKSTSGESVTGVHPTLGRVTLVEIDRYSGQGVIIHHGPARYERRPGELTSRELARQDENEHTLRQLKAVNAALHNIFLKNPRAFPENVCSGDRALDNTGGSK